MKSIIILLFITFSFYLSSDDKLKKEQKKLETYNFDSIKDVIKSDHLEVEVNKKIQNVKQKVKKENEKIVKKFDIPGEREFWSFFSEYWLIKNAPELRWDFQKPDYGLDGSFRKFLESQGYLEKSFKILLLNSPNITHLTLPTNPGEHLFLLSVPFIKTMDLSKQEISLLLFEDYIRNKLEYFKKYVQTEELKKAYGNNFYGKKLDEGIFNTVLKKYDELAFKKGFSFQQQFEVTKQVGIILKNDLQLWNSYMRLLQKIDDLVKNNVLYKEHNRLYPSPEMQIKWLTPKKKVL